MIRLLCQKHLNSFFTLHNTRCVLFVLVRFVPVWFERKCQPFSKMLYFIVRNSSDKYNTCLNKLTRVDVLLRNYAYLSTK